MRGTSLILDAGAGTGVWGQAAKERWKQDARIIGVEVRKTVPPSPFYDEWRVGDYRLIDLPNVDIVIGNPPFKYAEAFVRRSIELVTRRVGRVVFLLPLSFLGGQARGDGLFVEHPPTTVIVLSKRPGFMEKDSETDEKEYMLCYWDLGELRKEPRIKWLNYAKAATHRQSRLF